MTVEHVGGREAVRELMPGNTELLVLPGTLVSEEVTEPQLSTGSALHTDGFRGYPENKGELKRLHRPWRCGAVLPCATESIVGLSLGVFLKS